jgi:hypothetical protein
VVKFCNHCIHSLFLLNIIHAMHDLEKKYLGTEMIIIDDNLPCIEDL